MKDNVDSNRIFAGPAGWSYADWNGIFYILTNYKAKNFRLMKTPVNSPSRRNWREVIPHREDVLLQGMEVFSDYLVLNERKEGLVHLRIIEQNTGEDHYLDFGEEAYYASISVNP